MAAVASADLDDDGLPDLITAGDGLAAWHNRGGRFEPWPLPGLGEKGRTFADVLALDADNDGRLDLAATGPDALLVLGRRGDRDRPAFEKLAIEAARREPPRSPRATWTATAISISRPPAPPASTAWRTWTATATTGSTCASRP